MNSGNKNNQITEDHWSRSMTKLMSFRFSEKWVYTDYMDWEIQGRYKTQAWSSRSYKKLFFLKMRKWKWNLWIIYNLSKINYLDKVYHCLIWDTEKRPNLTIKWIGEQEEFQLKYPDSTLANIIEE